MTHAWQKALAEMRKPFTPAAVRFKPLTKPRDGKSSAAFYIDARLVAERLNAAVGPENWTDEYRLIADGRETPALFYPIECRLTVLGITKTDVGQGANQVVDEKAWKSAYSDALKRAAVKFGIGAYLYAIPRLWAPVDVGQDGKAKGFSKEGQTYLLTKYKGWLASPLNTFGDPLDHGDIHDEESPEISPEEKTPALKPAAKSAGTTTAGTAAEEAPVPAAPTASDLTALYKLVEERGGDVKVTMNAAQTATERGKLAGWYSAAKAHWEAQPLTFSIPEAAKPKAAA